MIDQLLTISPDARTKIDAVRSFNDFPEAALRVRILAKDGPRFRYEIALEDPRERAADDLAVESDGLTVVLDPATATDLAGATIELDPAVTGVAPDTIAPIADLRDGKIPPDVLDLTKDEGARVTR